MVHGEVLNQIFRRLHYLYFMIEVSFLIIFVNYLLLGNSINHNITWRDLVNETWVSKPLPVPKELPSDEDLFERVMKRMDA